MIAPTIISRADHSISRDNIDPDALRVLYRLRKFNHTAYLVGGGVRDLLLERQPKDFDIGTSAHPNEVKRIFLRHCWIIGRRFRLAHVKYGNKTIEVATFRRVVPDQATAVDRDGGTDAGARNDAAGQAGGHDQTDGHLGNGEERRPIRRDNTFGTPEEDAFRRDFTINGLFYDISTFAVIDYVGGMKDLRRRLIRCIGDPNERFIEDPVRMIRAVAFAARLGFRLDPPVRAAIAVHAPEIRSAAPARLMEEVYKLLRSGAATKTFRLLSRTGLLAEIAPDVDRPSTPAIWQSLDRLDTYRNRHGSAPDTLTNAVLLGSLVTPVMRIDLTPPARDDRTVRVSLGDLTVPRRDAECLRRLLVVLPRLTQPDPPPGAIRSILAHPSFPEALTWLEIHGGNQAALERWQHQLEQELPPRPRRSRRRPRRRRRPPEAPESRD